MQRSSRAAAPAAACACVGGASSASSAGGSPWLAVAPGTTPQYVWHTARRASSRISTVYGDGSLLPYSSQHVVKSDQWNPGSEVARNSEVKGQQTGLVKLLQ